MRVSVPLRSACKLLNHGPTTLISSAHGGRRNVMAAAWVMPIDFEPCKLAAVIAGDTWTREPHDPSHGEGHLLRDRRARRVSATHRARAR